MDSNDICLLFKLFISSKISQNIDQIYFNFQYHLYQLVFFIIKFNNSNALLI